MLILNKDKSQNIALMPDMPDTHTWLEISKSAILHNLAQYKKVIGNKILAPVIKANAYGHGLKEIGTICEQSPDVDWFCVTLLSDALKLRTYGIKKPILVFGPIDTDLTAAVNQNIEFIAYNKKIISTLNTIGKKHNFTFNIHLKIDTGLSRIGIAPNEIDFYIAWCKKLSRVCITGISTHLAQSNDTDQTFTKLQLDRFNLVLSNLKKRNVPYIHFANTAATTIASSEQCNFFRIGIGAYGLWPSKYVKEKTQKKYPWFSLKQCMSWKTRVIEVKKISAYSYVGYNRMYQVSQDTTIAILPVGYFDGYDMRFSNKTKVHIRNQYAPVIGRVCMNYIIVDVTHIPNAQIDDKVTLLGNNPEISPYYFAKLTGNNNVREILTKIFPHIPRVIIE